MNGRRLTDAQISKALRAHLPERAQAGLRERILEAAEDHRAAADDCPRSLGLSAMRIPVTPPTQPADRCSAPGCAGGRELPRRSGRGASSSGTR